MKPKKPVGAPPAALALHKSQTLDLNERAHAMLENTEHMLAELDEYMEDGVFTRAEYRPGDNGDTFFDFVFETTEDDGARRVAATLRTVPGVASIKQVHPAKLFGAKT